MSKVTSAQAAEKWSRRLSGSGEDFKRGVASVTTAPGQKAASKADKMLAKLTESITSGRWAAAVSSVSLQEWKDSMTNKALQRIASGASGATPKVQAFMNKLLPYIESLKSEIENMPSNTTEDSIARMNHWTRKMAEFKKGNF